MTNTLALLLAHLKKPYGPNWLACALMCLLFACHPSHAEDAGWQTLAQLYAHPNLQNLPKGSQVSIRVQNHPKLNDQQCPLALFKLAAAQKPWGKTVAQAQCPGQQGHLFYVQLMVDVMAPVLITSRRLSKGQELSPEDLSIEMRNITQLKGGYFHTPKQLEQKKTTQHLPAGAVIEPRYVEGPTLIKQGDKVRIKVIGDGFGVEGQALALDSGGFGDAVRVRTPQGRVLRGKAIEFMVVELLL